MLLKDGMAQNIISVKCVVSLEYLTGNGRRTVLGVNYLELNYWLVSSVLLFITRGH
jgi:hypothetical protein